METVKKYLYISESGTIDSFRKRLINFLAVGLVFFLLSLSSSIVLTYLGFHPFFMGIELLKVLPIIGAFFMLLMIFISLDPIFKGIEHVKDCEREAPYLNTLMTLFAAGGLPPHQALNYIPETSDVFPASAKMVNRINKVKNLFALDEVTAIEVDAKQSPSHYIFDFLMSLVAAETRGGNVYNILRDKMRSSFNELKQRYSALSSQMKTVSDVVLILFGVLPMAVYTIFSMFASAQTIMQCILYSLIINPILGIMIVYIIDAMYPKTPVSYKEYYKRLAYFIPIGLIFSILSYYVFPYLPLPSFRTEHFKSTETYRISFAVGIGIIVTFLEEAIHFTLELSRLNSIDAALPSFIRDLTEEVKKGESPSLAINSLISTRSYGVALDEVLKTINAALKVGYNLTDAIKFVRKKISWQSNLILTLTAIADWIGLKVEVFEELTEVTREIRDLISAAKSSIAPMKMFGIVTALLVVGTTGILINAFIIPISNLGERLSGVSETPVSIGGFSPVKPEQLPLLIDSIFLGSILTVTLLGLLTGKMSEGNLASGFLYVVIMVSLSLVSIVLIMSVRWSFGL